ncbi:ankyrin repeat domain-containing protein [Cupriavidus basilensis]|uniref:ankyrin repeat domain-containing protein n=1 Tax=Cupriavidus TaxID=106589 RepID=UPI0023E793D2|nr:ankyrin repeat domain-containing protein [Cupriavidus basilensis]MDF3888713.1 ankyrin repeat domain-containing protein [Cupriavidus basilensis]
MPRTSARPRRLVLAEVLGLTGLLMGGALLAGPGGTSLAARPAGGGPAQASPRSHAQGAGSATTAHDSVGGLDRNLIAAATLGDLELVKRLLAAGASAQTTDERGRSALLVAVYSRHTEVAKALVAAGADVNRKDIESNSPFLLAAATGQLEMVQLALTHGADLTSTDINDSTALIVACEHGNTEVVKVLLKAGVAVDHVNRQGWTALLETIVMGDGSARYEDTVQLLLDAGADANLPDRDGTSPTRHARERSYKTMVKMLVRVRGH